jgi:ArsR family transcriptional regulator, lead/cadmium/zinc/bismuth-responsive transcriptional repressor
MDGDIEYCSSKVIHMEAVEKTKEMMLSDSDIYDISELYKILGDPTRVKILCALTASEMCVCDMAYLLGMTQSAVSHQLRVLKQSRLVRYRKEGRIVFYMLDDSHVKGMLECGLEHISENK